MANRFSIHDLQFLRSKPTNSRKSTPKKEIKTKNVTAKCSSTPESVHTSLTEKLVTPRNSPSSKASVAKNITPSSFHSKSPCDNDAYFASKITEMKKFHDDFRQSPKIAKIPIRTESFEALEKDNQAYFASEVKKMLNSDNNTSAGDSSIDHPLSDLEEKTEKATSKKTRPVRNKSEDLVPCELCQKSVNVFDTMEARLFGVQKMLCKQCFKSGNTECPKCGEKVKAKERSTDSHKCKKNDLLKEINNSDSEISKKRQTRKNLNKKAKNTRKDPSIVLAMIDKTSDNKSSKKSIKTTGKKSNTVKINQKISKNIELDNTSNMINIAPINDNQNDLACNICRQSISVYESKHATLFGELFLLCYTCYSNGKVRCPECGEEVKAKERSANSHRCPRIELVDEMKNLDKIRGTGRRKRVGFFRGDFSPYYSPRNLYHDDKSSDKINTSSINIKRLENQTTIKIDTYYNISPQQIKDRKNKVKTD